MRKALVLLIGVLFACSQSEEELAPEVIAEAEIYAIEQLSETTYQKNEEEKIGMATFSQAGDVVTLTISLLSMTPNSSKAVHIHRGTVEEPGRHWNQGSFIAACNERSLGEVWARPFYGDVGNVPIDADGNGIFVMRTDLWRINTGDEMDVLNLPIIIHDQPEDFVEECNPAHSHDHVHSNPKIGGGTIELVSEVPITTLSVAQPEAFPDFTICK